MRHTEKHFDICSSGLSCTVAMSCFISRFCNFHLNEFSAIEFTQKSVLSSWPIGYNLHSIINKELWVVVKLFSRTHPDLFPLQLPTHSAFLRLEASTLLLAMKTEQLWIQMKEFIADEARDTFLWAFSHPLNRCDAVNNEWSRKIHFHSAFELLREWMGQLETYPRSCSTRVCFITRSHFSLSFTHLTSATMMTMAYFLSSIVPKWLLFVVIQQTMHWITHWISSDITSANKIKDFSALNAHFSPNAQLKTSSLDVIILRICSFFPLPQTIPPSDRWLNPFLVVWFLCASCRQTGLEARLPTTFESMEMLWCVLFTTRREEDMNDNVVCHPQLAHPSQRLKAREQIFYSHTNKYSGQSRSLDFSAPKRNEREREAKKLLIATKRRWLSGVESEKGCVAFFLHSFRTETFRQKEANKKNKDDSRQSGGQLQKIEHWPRGGKCM